MVGVSGLVLNDDDVLIIGVVVVCDDDPSDGVFDVWDDVVDVS